MLFDRSEHRLQKKIELKISNYALVDDRALYGMKRFGLLQ